jgi:hypothetical protein
LVSASRSGFGIRIRIQEGKKVLQRKDSGDKSKIFFLENARLFLELESSSMRPTKKNYIKFLFKNLVVIFFPTEIFPILKTLEARSAFFKKVGFQLI